MTRSQPVCVVIPARNAEATIRETLLSVCDCRGVTQIVVVDDGSTDDTRGVAQSLNDGRIEIVVGPATGISGALNAGFNAVRTPFVMRCDADDTIPEDRLDWQLPLLDGNSELAAVSAGFETMLEDGTPCGWLACSGEVRDVTQTLRDGETVTSFCTWLTRIDAIKAVGGARDWFRTAEDVDLQLRLAVEGRILHVPRVSYSYRMHDNSIVHSTADSTRFFFDRHAAEFVVDRCRSGSDALERGDALPSWPPVEQGKMRTAFEQGRGHAIATAWTEANLGKHGAALKRLARLLRKVPGSGKIWLNFTKIAARAIAARAGF